MDLITRIYVKARHCYSGQSLNEYMVILAAVAAAIEVFVTYEVLANPIPHM